jgi:hypothetical protein
MCKCEDENYLRGLIREELTKMRQEHLSKGEQPVHKLVALYFDNFPADAVKPSGALVGANVKLILKQLPYEQLEALIPILAASAKPISASWCNWAKEQIKPREKITPPTPIPPKFVNENRKNSTPMPANFRDMVFKHVDDA